MAAVFCEAVSLKVVWRTLGGTRFSG